MQHLEYSGKLKLDTIQISSIGDFESLEPAHLATVRDKARELNITIDARHGLRLPYLEGLEPEERNAPRIPDARLAGCARRRREIAALLHGQRRRSHRRYAD